MTPRIIIADDHSMIRKGIKLLLTNKFNYRDVSEADSCSGLMSELKRTKCTHLILDVIFSDGTSLEIVPAITKLYPEMKIMIFSMQLGEVYFEAFRQYGIHHYLNKSSNEEETIKYIQKFLSDESIPHSEKTGSSTNPFSLLTARELEVLHYLLNGYKTKDIATTLNIRDSTVSTYKNQIFEKTGSSNIAQIIELASLYNLSITMNTPKGKTP